MMTRSQLGSSSAGSVARSGGAVAEFAELPQLKRRSGGGKGMLYFHPKIQVELPRPAGWPLKFPRGNDLKRTSALGSVPSGL